MGKKELKGRQTRHWRRRWMVRRARKARIVGKAKIGKEEEKHGEKKDRKGTEGVYGSLEERRERRKMDNKRVYHSRRQEME